MNSRFESKKRRAKFPYILLLTFIILVGFTSFGYFRFMQQNDRNQMKEVANTFIHILENKNYRKLGDVLDEQSYTSLDYSLDTVIEKYENIFNGIQINQVHASNVTLSEINDDEQDFSFQLSFTTPLGKLENLQYHTKIVKTGDHFQVKWDPSLILPGMEGKDKVSFRRLKAERGEIKDRLGNGLAVNQDFISIGVVPKELGQGDEREKRLHEISKQFNIPVDEINQRLAQGWVKDDVFVPLKITENKPAKEVPGIFYQTKKIRYYPLKEAAAHLIGYTGKVTKEDLDKHPNLAEGDIIGKAGLERALDKELRGRDGGEIYIVDQDGNKKHDIQTQEKVDGEDIQLTLDTYVQKEAFDTFKGKAGSTVVMDPKEGGLYAVVSSPSFDPNKMAQGISQEDYNDYAEDPHKPFIARYAVRYAPGSTFKAITASIGLDANITYPDKTREIHGLSWKKDQSWGGYSVTRVSDVTHVDMRKALIYSDNIYFAQEALEMGEKKFRDGLKNFLFGEKLDLPIAMEPAQISNKSTFGSDILLADTGYGQGELLISPIQQAVMYSVFQNKGEMVYPTLLANKEKPKTKTAITTATANEMKSRLKEVVSNPSGTAHLLSHSQYTLAAKTGTAEIKMQQGKKGVENSFLLAFEPEQDSFLLLSLVEDYSPGSSATQLNKTFIDDLYGYLQKR